MKVNLNLLISIRGQREQFHKFFAHNFKGGIKGVFRKGAEVKTPLMYAFTSHDIQNEMLYERVRIGEESPELNVCDLLENVRISLK